MHSATIDRLDSVSVTELSLAVTREGLKMQARGLLKGDDLLGPQGLTITFEGVAWPAALMDMARQLLATAETHVAAVLSSKKAVAMAAATPKKEPELLPPPGMAEDEEDGDIASGFRDDVHQL